MSVDHFARSGQRWAEGAILVYAPIAAVLIASSPHSLQGRHVLDLGAGTGVAAPVLARHGAEPVSVDLSFDMLAWNRATRPPAVVDDIFALPLADCAVDDHLVEPARAVAEIIRVMRPGGALLACVYPSASRSEVRDALDDAARREGWQVLDWYLAMKQHATPILGTAEAMARVTRAAGLVEVTVAERPVDVGVTKAEQLVNYRLGQAKFSVWLDKVGPDRADEIKARVSDTIRPIMRPYVPIVVFVTALTQRR